MERRLVPGTQIETVRDRPLGAFGHAIFDFDGTISLLREGWQGIMAPVMVDMICGDTEPTQAIRDEVAAFIDETTGVQTILQMARLVEMVQRHGRVAPGEILDAQGYKALYNERLMAPVRERLAKLDQGELPPAEALVPGALEFLRELRARGLDLYLVSGTDHADVVHEAEKLGAAQFFNGGIMGAEPVYRGSNKEQIIRTVIDEHGLHGAEVLVCGDGPVEMRHAREHECVALGVASNEQEGAGWDWRKRERLITAGAEILIPAFEPVDALLA